MPFARRLLCVAVASPKEDPQFCSDRTTIGNLCVCVCVPFCQWSVSTTFNLISSNLTSQAVHAAYTNHSAGYPCVILYVMWGQRCKIWLQSPASLVAMKQSHTSPCMCEDGLEAFLSPKFINLEVEGKPLEELYSL